MRERLRRSDAADYVQEQLGRPVSPNKLRVWPIPYKLDGRDAIYEVSDLDLFIRERLAAAPKRRVPELDWAALYRERLELLRRDVDENEARARAYEYAVRIFAKHHGCNFEIEKRLVRTAIAAAAP
jgi:hypothetical protein